MNEEDLFHQACARPAAERSAFLDEACAGDSKLRQRLQTLIEAHESGSNLLDRPALEPISSAAADTHATLPFASKDVSAELKRGSNIPYFGDYEVIEEIARGGMGVVYKARQVSLNRVVALKMILAGQLASDAEIQRFRTEAEAAANLNHPNIVPIYEIGEHRGQHYFSMKLVEGTSLATQTGTFLADPKSAAELVAKVARAVHDAHEHGILHRDLKPSNILLDGRSEPYLVDFGLAKHADGRPTPTRTGAIMGTPSYMAPEQARSEKNAHPRGGRLQPWRHPLRAADRPAAVSRGKTSRHDLASAGPQSFPASTLNSRIERDLETICLKCLDKDPRKRYASALALAEDLDRWRTGQSIEARPSGRSPAVGSSPSEIPRRRSCWWFSPAGTSTSACPGSGGGCIGSCSAGSCWEDCGAA